MSTSIVQNRDCLEAMKEFPDKFFDLAIVDPPYGDGSQNVQVERERERERESIIGTDLAVDLTNTKVSRTGGKWAAKYGKKS